MWGLKIYHIVLILSLEVVLFFPVWEVPILEVLSTPFQNNKLKKYRIKGLIFFPPNDLA